MDEETAAVIIMVIAMVLGTILAILFGGEPDVMDALVAKMGVCDVK